MDENLRHQLREIDQALAALNEIIAVRTHTARRRLVSVGRPVRILLRKGPPQRL